MDAFASPAQLVPGKKYFTHKLGLDYIFSFFSVFVLLSAPRGTILDSAVEHFFIFLCFCSTFSSARTEFGEPGRQKSDIHHGFCLLSGSRDLISESLVDKNQAFPPVFVYF